MSAPAGPRLRNPDLFTGEVWIGERRAVACRRDRAPRPGDEGALRAQGRFRRFGLRRPFLSRFGWPAQERAGF
jgi:hypothetical protein